MKFVLQHCNNPIDNNYLIAYCDMSITGYKS